MMRGDNVHDTLHQDPLSTGISVLVILLATEIGISSGTNMITPSQLTCEFRTDPLGIDTRRPRLGWVLESADRGASQTAYRILVSSTAPLLAADTGDLWDSGKMPGDRTASIRYEGRPLSSHQMCFWKVMAWDGDTPGPWSKPASGQWGFSHRANGTPSGSDMMLRGATNNPRRFAYRDDGSGMRPTRR